MHWRKWLTTLFFNAFAVERKSEGKREIQALRLLEADVPILLFPEGGRSRAGELRPFKSGAALFSISSGKPVVPMALVGASAAMPRGTNWPVRGRPRIDVVIGAPMTALPDERPRDFAARQAEAVRELHETIAPIPVQQANAGGERA